MSLNQDIESNIKNLKAILEMYNKVRPNVEFDDLIGNDGRLLTTNLQLLEDAIHSTSDLADINEKKAHQRAKEALLLWGIIYCEKCIAAHHYSKSEDKQIPIITGSKKGVLESYERLREDLEKYFELPERERQKLLDDIGSVRTYMLFLATCKASTEFKKMMNHFFLRISEEKAKQFEKQEIPVFESKGQYYTPKYVSDTFSNNDNDATFDNPEVTDFVIKVEHGAHKLMDQAALVQGVKKLLDSLDQKGVLTDLEIEYVRDVIMMGNQKKIDKFREWQKNGIEERPDDIYDFERSLLRKMRNAIEGSELSYLAELVQRAR